MTDNTVQFVSRDALLEQAITAETETYREPGAESLPQSGDAIVQNYIRKIEGRYDVERAKLDTDNTNDLLYIAYNTTPQEADAIRIAISGIMDKLIRTQQDSELVMKEARRVAGAIITDISEESFIDWLDVKDVPEAERSEAVQVFLADDLQTLTENIRREATAVQAKLMGIADRYDEIIADTQAATSDAEGALGKRLEMQAEMLKEIHEAEAERARLDSLVADLQAQVKKYDDMAKQFADRAETAEERAFVMSIVRVGCEMLSAAIPPLVMAASGPGSFLAAAAGNATSSAGESDDSASSTGSTADNTQEIIDKKTEVSGKQAELDAEKENKKALEEKLTELKETRTKLEPSETATSSDVKEETSPEVSALDERIGKTEKEIAASERKIAALTAGLESLQAALGSLSSNLRELTAEQKSDAANLRDMQFQMLEKVEKYETARRDQAAELAKITALLAGKRSDEETMQLAVKSLNVSISALKRSKEIVVEMAAFFKSFADFIGTIADQAKTREERIASLTSKSTIRARALQSAIDNTDRFLIQQVAEWQAVSIVSDKFIRNFADGWSQLNKLNGTYITGDKLKAYLDSATVRMSEIVNDRERAAKARIEILADYRKQLENQQVV